MCGISGFCSFKDNYAANKEKWINVLTRMRTSIAHRGHDDVGEYLCENAGFAHTRLSIRDLVSGRQPMSEVKNDFKYTIVYNGEIYNTDELKENLLKKGYEFKTTSDTEVILLLYIEYREKCAEMLNGIFAFSIYDEENKKLFLCRDRSGIKPLFYAFAKDTLIFASEIKAIFEHPYFTPEIDINGIREIIGIGPARTDGCGIFKGILEIKQGCFAFFSKDGFFQKKYWHLLSKPHRESYEETVHHTRYLVESAIKMQMVSDVEVCTFLSGGIDSSIVTAVAFKYMQEKGETLNSFSFDFTDNDKYFKANSFQPERDIDFVNKMLKIYPTNHKYLECNQTELADCLYESVDAKDMPGMADVDASLLYFCREVAKHNKVALTGECADEIFAGYPWFHRDELIYCGTFPWTTDLSARTVLLNENYVAKLDIKQYIDMRYNEIFSEIPFLEGESAFERKQREISYLNQKQFMNTLLTRMDRASMYSGLEARVPFADPRIIEYMWNVPYEFKTHNGIVKALLRDAFSDMLPKRILYRKKSPYPKTYNPEYEKIIKKRFKDIVEDKDSPIAPMLDKKKCRDYCERKFEAGKPFFGQLMAAPQLLAYFIQIDFWLKKYGLSL